MITEFNRLEKSFIPWKKWKKEKESVFHSLRKAHESGISGISEGVGENGTDKRQTGGKEV